MLQYAPAGLARICTSANVIHNLARGFIIAQRAPLAPARSLGLYILTTVFVGLGGSAAILYAMLGTLQLSAFWYMSVSNHMSWCHTGFAPRVTADDNANADSLDSTDNDVGMVSEGSVPLSELDWEFELGPTGGLQIVSHGSFQAADTGVVETDRSGHASTADIEDMRDEEPELLWEG